MKKHVLVSFVAVAASPLAAYADADANAAIKNQVTDWTSGETDISFEGDVYTSPNGTPMEQVVKLLPGSYTLTATTENARISVNGTELGEDGSFSVEGTAETDVRITINAVTENQPFTVKGIMLTLKYDFVATAARLQSRLSGIIAGMNEGDKNAYEAAKLQERITGIKTGTYDIYREEQLYIEPLKIDTELDELAKSVQGYAANVAAFNKAQTLLAALNESYNKVNAVYEGASEYAKNKYKEDIATAKRLIDALKEEVESSKDKPGEFNEAFSEEKLKDTEKYVNEALGKVNDGIQEANADDDAYTYVKAGIDAVNAKNMETIASLSKGMYEYTALRATAQSELGAIMKTVVALNATDKNGTEDLHDNAKETRDANMTVIEKATADIADLEKRYLDEATALHDASENAKEYLKTLRESFGTITESDDVKAEFAKEIGDIETLIADFEKAVNDANNGESIKTIDQETPVTIKNYYDSEDYNAKKTVIETALVELGTNAQPIIVNYTAYTEVDKLITELQGQLDEAKEAVAALKSDVEGYSAVEKFKKTADDLQAAITGYTEGVKKAYKEKTAAAYQTDNSGAIEQTSADIAGYQTMAKEAAEKNDEVSAAIKAYRKAYKELSETVGDYTYVTAGGTETYGEKMSGIDERIAAIEKSFAAAGDVTDKEHHSLLTGITLDGSITTDANALVSSFAKDKETYDENATTNAAKKMLEIAKSKIGAARTTVDGIWTEDGTTETLGLGYTGCEEMYNEIIGKLGELYTKVNIEVTAGNAAEAISKLTEVNDEIDELSRRINKLSSQVTAAKEKVEAENKAKKEADGKIGELQKLLTEAVMANEDIDRAHEFSNKAKPIVADIKAQNNAIEAARKAETLCEDMDDKTGEDGTVVEGINTKLGKIDKEIRALRADAEASTENFKAKAELVKAYDDTKITVPFTEEENKVTEATKDPAEGYYLAEIDKQEEEWKQISEDITKAYGEGSAVEQKENLMARIEAVKTFKESVVKAATDNHTANDALEKLSKAVKEEWTEAYNNISANDHSTTFQQKLDDLAQIMIELTELDTKANGYFGEGKSKGNQTGMEAEYTGLQTRIGDINKYVGSDEYKSAIAVDNETRYKNFCDALNATKAEYNKAIDIINRFNSISNPELKAGIDDIIKANSDVRSYDGLIRTLEKNAGDTYGQTLAPELFDAEESFKATAVEYGDKIKAAVKELSDGISGKVNAIYNDALGKAQSAYEAAIAEITDAGYDKDVVKSAFAGAKEIIDGAQALETAVDLAVQLDREWLDKLGTVENLIAAGKEPVAQEQWDVVMEAAETRLAEERASLEKFEYASESRKDEINKSYEEMVAKTVTAAKEIAEKAIADGNLYGENLKAAMDLVNSFNTDNIFSGAKEEAAGHGENLEAYARLTEGVEKLQAELDALSEYINAYAFVSQPVKDGVPSYQKQIDALKKDIAEARDNGQAASGKEAFEERMNTISGSVEFSYVGVNSDEKSGLEAQIKALEAEHKTAIAEFVGTEMEKTLSTYYDEHCKGLADGLASVVKDLETATNAEIQAAYLGQEDVIAKAYAGYVSIYNQTAITSAFELLSERLGTITADYEAAVALLGTCHEPVVAANKGAVDGIGEDIEAIKALLEKCKTDNTILFYSDKLSSDISGITVRISAAVKAMEDMEEPYDINDEAKARLDGELADLQAELDKLKETIGGLAHNDGIKPGAADADGKPVTYGAYYSGRIKDIQALVDQDKTAVDKAYASEDVGGMLKKDTRLENAGDVRTQMAAVLKYATYNENVFGIDNIEERIDGISTAIAGSTFAPEVAKAHKKELESLKAAFEALLAYNTAAYQGTVGTDINGDKLKDEQGLEVDSKDIDYMSEANAEIVAKIAELNDRLGALEANVEESSYVPGDADMNGKVNINDLNTVMRMSLGIKDVEAGTTEFLASDVNGDGNIDIIDVTCIINMLTGNGSPAAVAVKARMQTTETVDDRLSLSESSEGGMRRIAIELADTRAYAGCQMDVRLPEGMVLMSENVSSRAEGHTLESNDLADGTHRIIICSQDNSTFNNAGQAVVWLEVSGSGELADIVVDNVTFTDADGKGYRMNAVGGSTTAIGGVTEGGSLKEKVYSVGGYMMNAVRKGLNIIRKADGSTQKIVRK